MSVHRVTLSADDYDFIVNYDPERERSASRRDLVAVIEHIQTVIAAGEETRQPRRTPRDPRRHGLAQALHREEVARLEDRFRRDAPEGPIDDCWLWTGRLDGNGYGVLSARYGTWNRSFGAHRLAWVFAMDESIPEGMTIDHLCRTKNCVNPTHLEVVTREENTRRRPLVKRPSSWGNPANQRTCDTCGSVFHRTYIARHVCR